MPLKPGAEVGESISELHGGKTYKRTKRKYGKKRAQKQSIAIAYANKRKGKKKHWDGRTGLGKKKHRKGAKKSHRKR